MLTLEAVRPCEGPVRQAVQAHRPSLPGPVKNGTVKGSDVTFWFAMSVEGTAMNVTYTGKVEADGSLKGSVNYGDMMSGTFTATKKK